MKPIKKAVLLIVVCLVVCSIWFTASTYAEVPRLINYQGQLTDSQGKPLNGSYSVTIKIYETEAGGSPIWQETHSNLTIYRGIFNLMLGGITPLNLAFDKQYWLTPQVGSDAEMTPRQRLASAAYAFNAERLNGKPITEFSLANHTHDTSNITSGVLPISRGGTGVANKTTVVVTYAGNSTDNRLIPHGVGVKPDWIYIASETNEQANHILWTSGMPAGNSHDLLEYRFKTDCVKAVDDTNVTLGPNGRVNQSGHSYKMLCIKGQQ